MEQETHAPSRELPPSQDGLEQLPPPPAQSDPDARERALIRRAFVGPEGLRTGWSVLLFILFTLIFAFALGLILSPLAGLRSQGKVSVLIPRTALIYEIMQLVPVIIAGFLMALIERRRLKDYFLADRRGVRHFFSGIAAGIIALSLLVGLLAWGGWLHFGPREISGAQIVGYGSIWAVVFLLTGLFEEGSFRCYLQFTFTRGINFWWALGIVGALCLDLALRHAAAGWGVYLLAALGLLPCLWLHLRRAPGSRFWQAAWATSTLFGFIHVTNSGENWIGIFAAGAIGFVFCVSVWVTGSAWWAIGCHAAWDWAETFFYGTPNSGLIPSGHLLTTAPAGNIFWSGGTDGPEGSILIVAILVLLVIALLVLYGRKRVVALPQIAGQPAEQPIAS